MSQAQRCTQSQLPLDAQSWFNIAERWGEDPTEYWLDRARLSRRLADDPGLQRALEEAQRDGAPPAVLDTELLLAEAQRGQLTRLDRELSSLLVSDYPSDEVCHAYVEGCLIKYRLDDATAVLDVWELDFPNDARPHFLRGRILEHRTNVPGAQAEYRKALEKAPAFPAPAYNLARTLLTEQKPELALPFFERSATNSNYAAPGLVGMAQCHRILSQPDKAERCLKSVHRLTPAQRTAAYRLVGESSISGEVEPLAEQGRLAAETGDHAAAVRYLGEALAIDPMNWRIRYQTALSQRQTGQNDEAAQNLRRVEEAKAAIASCDRLFDDLRKDPNNISARLRIGEVFLEHLSVNQGIVWLHSVLDLAPTNPEAHRLLANYYEGVAEQKPEFAGLAREHRQKASLASPP